MNNDKKYNDEDNNNTKKQIKAYRKKPRLNLVTDFYSINT